MKKNKLYTGIVLLGLVVSIGLPSCQFVNKYKTPDIDSEGLYRSQASTDTTTIANIPWKEYFSDPVLQALIEEGINNNFDLKIAYTRIKQAEANLGIARAAYFPEVALVGSVTQNRQSIKMGKEKDVLGYHNENYALGISVGWELDLWGKLNRQSRSSYAQFLNSHAYRNLIQTSLVSNIATSYYSLLALDEKLHVTQEMIKLQKENVATMEAMLEAGLLNGAALEQSKTQLYDTETTVPDLISSIQQTENSICEMLGRKPGYVYRAKFSDQTVPQELAVGVPMQMLAKRPDVQQAELNFRSAFELTAAAQASFYPSVTLSNQSMIGYGATTLSKFFKPENIIANIVGSITQPLFAKKQLLGQLQIRKAQQEEALLTFEKTVLSAGQEVSNIMYTYETALSKDESRTNQVKAANNSVFFTQELLKAGEANYTEVLTAQQNLLQAQLGQVNDKLQQLQACVDLYRALGGGVE